MRIGLVSDSHGNLKALKQAVEKMGDVDAIFHMGDCIEDARLMRQWQSVPIFAVSGNMDYGEYERHGQILTEMSGKKFLLVHGDRDHVKSSYNGLFYRGQALGVDAICFGHTHQALVVEEQGILMMNPGSVALPYGNDKKTFGIITLEADHLKGEIIEI